MIEREDKLRQFKTIRNINFSYICYDSLTEFDADVEEEANKHFSYENREEWESIKDNAISDGMDGEWFGYPPPKFIHELENHKEFQNPALFKEVEEEIRSAMADFERLDLQNLLKVRKIAYNSMGFGVFSFDRAAMGLQKIRTESGIEKITTSVKDVYAYFINKPMEQRSVKLYIVAGALAHVSGKNMLYTGVGAAILAEYLMERNYSIEITVGIGSYDPDKRVLCMNLVKAKRFEDSLDRNLIAVLTSDPKYFRYKGFKALLSIYNKFGRNCPPGLGTLLNKRLMEEFVQDENSETTTAIVFQQDHSLAAIKKSIIDTIHRIKSNQYGNKQESN